MPKANANSLDKLLKERASRYISQETEQSFDEEEMLLFEQHNHLYAVPLKSMTEIRPLRRVTHLPLVCDYILGVINVRGKMMPLYRLDLQCSLHDGGFALVGSDEAKHVALWASKILGASSIKRGDIKPAPLSMAQAYIRGVSDKGLIFLDLNKLVNDQTIYQA